MSGQFCREICVYIQKRGHDIMMAQDPYFLEEKKNIKDILDENENLVYLVGAGVSINAPSNLPSARTISKSILEQIIPEKYVEFVSNHEGLRYEEIIEHIKTYFDSSLGFMEYFNLCRAPNLIHFYLAHAILAKSGVITTNFDYLIEWALHDILNEFTREKIKLVITKEDFDSIQSVQNDINEGYLPLFKIHGSFQNLATKADTRETLVTTTSALAAEKGEGEILGLESFKQRILEPFLKDKTLIVMGYSGSDDFDISPFLNKVKGIKRLVWIDHIQKSVENKLSSDITTKIMQKIEDKFKLEIFVRNKNIPKSDRVLTEICSKTDFEIIKIEMNTLQMVETLLFPLLFPNVDISKLPFVQNPEPIPEIKHWIAPLFKRDDDFSKYYIVQTIFKHIGESQKGVEAGLVALDLLKENPDENRELTICITLGLFYDRLNQQTKSLEFNKRAEKLAIKLGEKGSLGTIYNNLGALYHDQNKFDKAIEYYEKAFVLDERTGRRNSMGIVTLNISKIHNIKGEYEKALENCREAMELFDEQQNLRGKGECFKMYSAIYMNMGDFEKSLKFGQDSLIIAQNLGDVDLVAQLENKIGMIYVKMRNPRMALMHFKQSIDMYDKFGEDKAIIDPLYNLGSILMISKFYNEAAEFLVRAYELAREWDFSEKVANSAFNLAKVAIGLEYWDVALQYAKCAEEDYTRINLENRFQIQIENAKKMIKELEEKVPKM